MFPFRIRKISMQHTGSTKKEYHLVLIVRDSSKTALCICRWGKAGTWGEMQFHWDKPGDVFWKKLEEKRRRGYETTRDVAKVASDIGEFKGALGPYYFKIGADNLKRLIPDLDPKHLEGVKSSDPARWTENGEPIGAVKKPKHVEVEESRPSPTLEERVAQNPLWGAF